MRRLLALVAVSCFGAACTGGRSGTQPPGPPDPAAEGAGRSLPVRITFLDRDSLGLDLREPGYLLVMEYGAGRRSRVLYPVQGQGWTWSQPGRATIHARLDILGEGGRHLDGPSQCLIGSRAVSSWTPSDGIRATPTRAICGPIPTLRSRDSPPPRRANRSMAFSYEAGSPLDSYVVVLLVAGDISPELVLGGGQDVVPPVQRARALGEWLAWPRHNPSGWHAVAWLAPS